MYRENIQAVRDYYQLETSEDLTRQRKLVVLSVLGILNACLMTLRQTGTIKHLPDVPHRIFDANKVTTSTKAYEMGLPDGPTASVAYGLTMMLATFGGKKEIIRPQITDRLLQGLVVVNALAALQYLSNMFLKQKKICVYCMSATIINCLMVPLSFEQRKPQPGGLYGQYSR